MVFSLDFPHICISESFIYTDMCPTYHRKKCLYSCKRYRFSCWSMNIKGYIDWRLSYWKLIIECNLYICFRLYVTYYWQTVLKCLYKNMYLNFVFIFWTVKTLDLDLYVSNIYFVIYIIANNNIDRSLP